MNEFAQATDPRVLGSRLQAARKARGLTQEAVADALDAARTTIVAIEKGERRVSSHELITLARLFGRSVSELIGHTRVTEPFVAQFRTGGRRDDEEEVSADLEAATATLQRFAEQYLELEDLLDVPLARKYPREYDASSLNAEIAGEDIAAAERQRLGLGDGPLNNLWSILEADVGLRIFVIDLPSRIAGVFAYNDVVGGCIGINRRHPIPRRRWTLAHEYCHFLTSRYTFEVTWISGKGRASARERLADSFAKAFLMPPAGLGRRFSDLQSSRNGRVTVGDLCWLANVYQVSVQALTLMLEEMKRVPNGFWERLLAEGFRPREAQALLGLADEPSGEPAELPTRYEMLAVNAFDRGLLSEGQFARYLGVDRVTARERVAQLQKRLVAEHEGELIGLDLSKEIPRR